MTSDNISETFCVGCGHVTTMATAGAKVHGEFETPKGDSGTCVLVYCSECWAKIEEVISGHMERAYQLREELMRSDSEDSVGK